MNYDDKMLQDSYAWKTSFNCWDENFVSKRERERGGKWDGVYLFGTMMDSIEMGPKWKCF